MTAYTNINVDLLTPVDVSNSIIRKYYGNYIIGLVDNSSSFLHKKKRFRPGGLFCERIFGLVYVCINKNCQAVQDFNLSPILNKLCLNCKVRMIINVKRKYRFGSIGLNFPIINCYYFKSFINLIKAFKKIKKKYFYTDKSFIVNKTNFTKNTVFSSFLVENKLLNMINSFYEEINSMTLFKTKLDFLLNKKKTLNTQLKNFDKFIKDNMFLKKLFLILLPVLPTTLRCYAIDNKKISMNSNLNLLYNTIIDTNNESIDDLEETYNFKNILLLHILIEAVVTFAKPINMLGQNIDLYDKLYGKYGTFRQNLLGFRVDYSGRATIVPGPSLPMDTIGLPLNMGSSYIESLEQKKDVNKVYESSIYKDSFSTEVEKLYNILSNYSVIINRAPTLHKMNVQSFNPTLVEGEVIKFPPLLCAGYNADFDGDQMGVFSPIKFSSLYESSQMLRSLVNLYSPTTRGSVFNATQGILAGYGILSDYSYLGFINFYISNSYIDLLECSEQNWLVYSPILLRSLNTFYFTTCGRLLLHKNILNEK